MYNSVIVGYSRSPFAMANKGKLIDVKPVNLLAEVIKNLISQSVDNSLLEKVYQLQTGPAKRKDIKLIENQIKMVKDNKNLKDIYELFTQQILNKHHEL